MTRMPRAARSRRDVAEALPAVPRWIAGALLLTMPLAVSAPAAALSVGEPIGVSFAPEARTIEFGEYWEVTATLSNFDCVDQCDNAFDFIIQNASEGELVETPVFDTSVFVTSFDLSRNLPPGEYEITGKMRDDSYPMDPGNQPASLTITPAALEVEATIIPDPLQPAGAIVSAQLTGGYVTAVDECFGSTECHPQLPNGSWTILVRDGDNKTVHEETISTKGKASRYVSYYLHDVTPATDYTVDASFTPASDAKANFDLKPAAGVSFTSPDAPKSGDPDAAPTPDIEVETTASPTLPFWLVVLGIALVVLLGAAVIVFWILLRRRREPAPEAFDTTESGPVATTGGGIR